MSHRELLGDLGAGTRGPVGHPRRIGLIVVPTSRPHPHLRSGVLSAVDLARRGTADGLLVVVSKEADDPAAVAALAHLLTELPDHVGGWICALPEGEETLPSFAVDRLPLTHAHRRYGQGDPRAVNEVGAKRNLGLLTARALGARTVLFMDDDIAPLTASGRSTRRTLDEPTLRRALDTVCTPDGARAVGWELRGYDDNSVVCRAAALAGLPQAQFIGGGAVLVRVDETTPFFPAIYNEDWVFLLSLLRAGDRPTTVWRYGGDVEQDPYDGYKPRRARSEELGDILGEGLMSLLHDHPSTPPHLRPEASEPRFWREVITGRRRFVQDVQRRLAGGVPGAPLAEVERARQALTAALTVHRQVDGRRGFWAGQFAGYVAALDSDLGVWAKSLKEPGEPFSGLRLVHRHPATRSKREHTVPI